MVNTLPQNDQTNLPKAPSHTQQGVNSQSKAQPIAQVRAEPAQTPDSSGQLADSPGKPSTAPQPVVQSQTQVSGVAKEQKEAGPLGRPEAEKVPVTEVKEPEPSKEVEGWVEKLEKGEEIQLPQPVTDDYGQILVKASVPQKPKIVLPLDEEEVKEGKKHKVVESVRWLTEWCLRVIKLAHGRVFYKK